MGDINDTNIITHVNHVHIMTIDNWHLAHHNTDFYGQQYSSLLFIITIVSQIPCQQIVIHFWASYY